MVKLVALTIPAKHFDFIIKFNLSDTIYLKSQYVAFGTVLDGMHKLDHIALQK